MGKNDNRIIPINYTSREFSSIREDLIQIAERFYPDTFKDFSEASFGSLMIDTVAYVGDQLSFYLDYQANESFLNTAVEYPNIVRHALQMGYRFEGRPSTFGPVALYIIVPATSTGIGPDRDYIPIMKRGSSFQSLNGLSYMLTENIDFSDPKNKVVIAEVDTDTGAPSLYAIKTYGTVVSGRFSQERFNIGPYEKFKSVRLENPNVSEITSVFDSKGNEYFEVPYLSQDVIYREIANSNYKNDNVPSVLKPFAVPRRFTTLFDRSSVRLQFGTGNEDLISEDKVPEPQKIALDLFGKNYVTSTSFDPANLVSSDYMGIVPSDTVLTVSYRTTNPTNSNATVGSINSVVAPILEFENRTSLDNTKVNNIIKSIEVYNEDPIVGDVSLPTSNEIKRRVIDNFATQNRAVTRLDYEALAQKMPIKFGSIKRVTALRDPDSRKRNINLYVLSENTNSKLVAANDTIKLNLKTWLNNYKMINDTVDILDAKIVNIGINFSMKVSKDADKYTIMSRALQTLKDKYIQSNYIGEPFYVSDIYTTLNKLKGVVDVVTVQIIRKLGANYSPHTFNIEHNLSADGRFIEVPKNVALEIKFPDEDIKGNIV
tara:strand:- start:197 stop:1999 length:1803 start_codon:yes stop_codon:yes gene_type:complete